MLAESHPPCFGLLDPIHLALRPQLGLEWRKGAEHIEEQPSGRIACIDVLVEDLQVHVLARERLGHLAQMQGRAGQPIEARHHERIAFPHIIQARAELGTGPRRAA